MVCRRRQIFPQKWKATLTQNPFLLWVRHERRSFPAGGSESENRPRSSASEQNARPAAVPTLVAVSKTFDAADIRPVIAAGQRVFGENRVQEAQGKWPALRTAWPDLELHLIGPLQSNKAKEAVALFDVIETVDREKIAAELAKEIADSRKGAKALRAGQYRLRAAKAGIEPREAVAFVKRCREIHGLAIEGPDVHPAR